MTTKEWTVIKMGNEVRDGLPPVLRIVVPYRLAGRFFAGLTLNTDAYICAMAHESVHAYQGIVAPTRLADAEIALGRDGDRYPWENRTLHDGWKTELDALAAALSEQDEKRTIELSRKFISTRRARRLSRDLDTSLVNLERLREWEEGLAKYTELAIWKLASTDSTYRPILDLRSDPDFMDYKGFRQQWMQEVTTLRLQSGAGETRFYYSGMAQAFLLDRLLPDWRMRGLREGGSLEDLLSEAVDTGR